MAIKKSFMTTFGIEGEYWRIAQTNIDWTTMMSHIEVFLYVNQDIRKEGNTPIASKVFDISIMPYIGLNVGPVVNIAAVVYGILKTFPDFTDAEDIMDPGQVKIALEDLENLGGPIITPPDK